MKNYINKQLRKEINRLYFTNVQKSFTSTLFPISENTNLDELDTFANAVDDKYFSNLIKDLENEPILSFTKNLIKRLNVFNDNILSSFRTNYYPEVREVAQILEDLSLESYLVGGCVRDMSLNKVPKDFDFCTCTDINILEKVFSEKGYKVDAVGKAFLVLVVSKNNQSFEIANFRKDIFNSSTDGRHPSSVEIGTIEEDAQRRSFGINAGYYNLSTNKIKDPNAQFFEDIQTETIKFIGNPKDRLQEDFLRGFRFYRFISRGFNPDKKSLKAVRENWTEIYTKSNPERVRTEIEKIIL